MVGAAEHGDAREAQAAREEAQAVAVRREALGAQHDAQVAREGVQQVGNADAGHGQEGPVAAVHGGVQVGGDVHGLREGTPGR